MIQSIPIGWEGDNERGRVFSSRFLISNWHFTTIYYNFWGNSTSVQVFWFQIVILQLYIKISEEIQLQFKIFDFKLAFYSSRYLITHNNFWGNTISVDFRFQVVIFYENRSFLHRFRSWFQRYQMKRSYFLVKNILHRNQYAKNVVIFVLNCPRIQCISFLLCLICSATSPIASGSDSTQTANISMSFKSPFLFRSSLSNS